MASFRNTGQGRCVRRVSSHTNNANAAHAHWRKSTRSQQNGACVEVADLAATVGVRDSKAPDAGHLSFALETWAGFMAEARSAGSICRERGRFGARTPR
ncbi:DUF397 domain-containing protein [Actinomadura sp. WMMB 499]|uniref:DUF397 domain-containing protein n=1 Tax=Actinomadura sp. WMMB 499 TaxID=1219491 RepID=UPI001243E287|nr:DUF397 domain-containing protein [Actinomadura sp. WMMB 499]QFG21392.1 DUF397 domain-containing protein [Actinomadura sp. WMMB 499]